MIAPRVILITDPAFGDAAILRGVEIVAGVLPAGWLAVQLRDKRRAGVSLRVFASHLRIATRAAGAALVINGDARLARDCGADGVHLGGGAGTVEQARAIVGQRSWISVATHDDAGVRAAAIAGADAALVSPIFATRPSSLHASPKEGRGLAALRSA